MTIHHRQTRRALIRWDASFLFLAATAIGASAGEIGRVAVKGNGTELGETPIKAEVSGSLAPGAYVLKSKSGDHSHVANVYKDGGKTYLSAVLEHVPAKGEVVYTLETPSADSKHEGVVLKETGDEVCVTVDGKPFTVYRAKAGVKPYYFPVIGPTGDPITRAYPMEKIEGEKTDHPHQKSFWFTHGKVNGVDFWAELKGHGFIKETSRKIVSSGPAVGHIRTTDDWVGPDGKLVCKDERDVRFHDTEDARIVDFDIVIHAVDHDVTFGDTKEGMFGVRVATSMDVTSKKGGKITNAEGLNDEAAWGKASPWVDYTGPVNGKTVGVAILNHPSSFRYPTTWHVRTYGLFAANPFGWKDFGLKKSGDHTLKPGESIRFAYRVIFHKGDTAGAGLTAAHAAYANPPAVEVSIK